MRNLTSLDSIAWPSDVFVDRLFAACILAGFAFAVLSVLSRGRLRLPLARRLMSLGRRNAAAQPLDLMPFHLGSGIVGFGLFGVILRGLMGVGPSASLAGAALFGVGFSLLFVRLLRSALSDAGTEMEGTSLVGALAVVSLPIPSEGVGSIAYTAEGKRHVSPARDRHGRPLPTGTRVLVVDLASRIAVVEEF